MKKIILLSFVVIILTGCSTTTPLGNFTMASTHNVRGIDYDKGDNTKTYTTGTSCDRSFLGLSLGKSENKFQKAMDDAIRSGQKSGFFKDGVDGDLLVNVTITEERVGFLGYSSDCTVVTGDLVRVKK